MSRKTRRWEKRRTKRFTRILSLLEASNLDPKRNNRKTRLQQLWNFVGMDVSSIDATVVSNADEA